MFPMLPNTIKNKHIKTYDNIWAISHQLLVNLMDLFGPSSQAYRKNTKHNILIERLTEESARWIWSNEYR